VAEAGRVDIASSETEEVHGRMFYVAYRVPTQGAPRPVTFMWNGGPGSASATLHFESVGPKRIENGKLVDNQETILGVTDLVFVDAIGTGFSRVAKSEYEQEFYNTLGDIAAFTEFVRAWRLLNDAADAPLFVAGESFGSNRAAGVAEGLAKRRINVNGVVLISGGLGLEPVLPRELSAALRVPEWAAIALYHKKGATDLGGRGGGGTDTTAVKRAARAWATETYVPALQRAASLTDAERDAIIKELSHFTGIPADKINRQTLVITQRDFRTELLRDRGQTLPLFDMRRTTPVGNTGDDVAAMDRYLRRDLKYRTSLPYVGLGAELASGYSPTGVASPDRVPRAVNGRWEYFAPGTSPEERAAATAEAVRSGGGPPGITLPWTERAFALNPKMKVLVASGFWDSGSCLANQETVRRIKEPLQAAFTFRCYAGGHMMYKDADARVQFSKDLRALIQSATQR
jgi:carboxypeptidase C (cathepsin A)